MRFLYWVALVSSLSIVYSLPVQAEECANRSVTKVKKGHSKWKISGMLFGKHSGVDYSSTDFHLGGGLPQTPVKYHINTVHLKLHKTKGIAEKIRGMKNPLAIQFAIPYGDHGGPRDKFYDTYIALDAMDYYEFFDHSISSNRFGRNFRESCSIKRGKAEPKIGASGYVVRVERKGFIKRWRSCNVTINKGGTRREWRQRVTGYREKETCYYNGSFPSCYTEQIPIYQSFQADFPVTELLIAHSEEACAFAEDAGRSQVRVEFDYSRRKHAGTDPNETVIHGMTVKDN